MIIKNYSCFDLEQIAASGQCFRMTRLSPDSYSVISRGKHLTLRQDGNCFFFDCPQEDLIYWEEYFDCGTDYEHIQASVPPRDSYLTAAAAAGRGIRILRQEPWEMIITFVISQQKTIPKIREAVELLSSRFGSPIPGTSGLCSFPSPAQLDRASAEDLLEMKLGYRAKYIKQLCSDAVSGRLDLELLPTLSYEEAMEYLTGFFGIGKKVANCICLFGLHHIDAFPVDTWIEKILMREYYPKHPGKYETLAKSRLCSVIIQDFFGQYAGCAGVMQQYIFYYERLLAGAVPRSSPSSGPERKSPDKRP